MDQSQDAPGVGTEGQDTPVSAYGGLLQQAEECPTELARALRELREEVLRRRHAEDALAVRTAQLKAAVTELAQAEERERERLAGVLHDDLQQLLVAAKLQVARADRELSRNERHEVIREVTGILDDAIAQTRSLAVELSPPVTFESGLGPALEWLGRWMHEKHGLTIRVTAADEGPGARDGETSRMLFNAVRELLFNVAKHAQVKLAIVQVRRVGDQIQIVVEDKGKGSAALQSSTPGDAGAGLGLFNIRERLDLIGGRFQIDSAPGRGSRFTLQAPVGQSALG